MKAKEFVQQKIPNIKSEKHTTKGFNSRTYWLTRIIGDTSWFSEGETEAKAWKDAKERILMEDNND